METVDTTTTWFVYHMICPNNLVSRNWESKSVRKNANAHVDTHTHTHKERSTAIQQAPSSNTRVSCRPRIPIASSLPIQDGRVHYLAWTTMGSNTSASLWTLLHLWLNPRRSGDVSHQNQWLPCRISGLQKNTAVAPTITQHFGNGGHGKRTTHFLSGLAEQSNRTSCLPLKCSKPMKLKVQELRK